MAHRKSRLRKFEEKKTRTHAKVISNLSRHHVLPSSRGGDCSFDNISILTKRVHMDYHVLFGNMTPDEILDYFVNVLWKTRDGQDGSRFIKSWLKKYYDTH